MTILPLSNRQAKKLLKLLQGICTDADLAKVHDRLKAGLR